MARPLLLDVVLKTMVFLGSQLTANVLSNYFLLWMNCKSGVPQSAGLSIFSLLPHSMHSLLGIKELCSLLFRPNHWPRKEKIYADLWVTFPSTGPPFHLQYPTNSSCLSNYKSKLCLLS